ncbi:hypothetical protein AN958_11230 [Leucoagaricus sp. SymC.cos]|nr:hypothetical protein AN958_11230 [Leucoagaricus sp. SymC.cos]
MPTYDGISMTIRVDDVDLPEYMVEEDVEKKLVTCWIPSQVGKLMFMEVELVDDDSLLHTSNSASLGEISITCHFVEVVRSFEDPNYKKEFTDHQKVHERAKKGIAQHISLGNASEMKRDFLKTNPREHIATFIFRYRPLAYLQAQGIAPLDPTLHNHQSKQDKTSSNPSLETGDGQAKVKRGVPEEVKRESPELSDEDGGDDEQLRVLQAKLEEVKSQMDELAKSRKRKKREGTRSISKKIKTEEIKGFIPGEVIDLT